MRYLKLIIALLVIGVLLSTPRGVRAQESIATTKEIAPGCTIVQQVFPRQASRTINTNGSGTIITVWTDRGNQNPSWGTAEVKVWMAPGQPTWTVYDANMTTWTSSNCTANQMYNEFQKNPLPFRSWNDLCGAKITCQPATTGPTPTPGPGNGTGVCTALQADTIQRGTVDIQQTNSGKMLTLWTDRGSQNPGWGNAEVKVWMAPGQPVWKIYDAGGKAVYSNTCNTNQMYERYKQEQKQEVTWNQLCQAGITCQPQTTSPTPTPNPTGTPNPTISPGGACQNMQAMTLNSGDHTLPVPGNGGAILTVWSGKQGVPWGAAEKKTFLNAGEQWRLFSSGGTLWTSNSCSYDQMRARFSQVQFEEKSWQDLCDAKITCQ